eukprot:scaffold10460_cov90-Isochrysis_galbana.AAC.2
MIELFPAIDTFTVFPLNAIFLANNLLSVILGEKWHAMQVLSHTPVRYAERIQGRASPSIVLWGVPGERRPQTDIGPPRCNPAPTIRPSILPRTCRRQNGISACGPSGPAVDLVRVGRQRQRKPSFSPCIRFGCTMIPSSLLCTGVAPGSH